MTLPLHDEKEVLDLPGISIMLPFEPKMTVKRELEYKLQRIAGQVESYLSGNYVDETVTTMMNRLNHLIKSLNYSTYKKSIAIYLSPLMEKVYYLDIPVEEKLVLDEPFRIRDLVDNKKELHRYLVLVLSHARSRLYKGDDNRFVRLASNSPAQVAGCRREAPARLADPLYYREVMLDKFLRYADHSLGLILKAYQLPLFVMATEKVMAHFKKITHYAHRITGYIHGNYEEASEAEIRKAIAPHVADWQKIREADLLLRLDAARGKGKLATGIKKVWQAAAEKKGRLLVAEKNYLCAAVDEVIEKVLENGGDVDFVADDALADCGHIALIQYY